MYRIREILEQKGITAKELAEKMGSTPQYISGIIREKDTASVRVLSNIAQILNVPLSSLFDDYQNEPSSNSINVICPHCGKEVTVKLTKPSTIE
jgi:transcriptional regulator with XRE-family HTH domain